MIIANSIPLVLVGNKTDLHMQRLVTIIITITLALYSCYYFRVISTEMGKKLAADWKASFVECSAKQNEVKYLFIKCMFKNTHAHVGR